jgi:NAD(P)-dependent dehydrogenase (short-subunit alcohol dehydrogenase family)
VAHGAGFDSYRRDHHQHDSLCYCRSVAGTRREAGIATQPSIRGQCKRGRATGSVLRGLSQKPQTSFRIGIANGDHVSEVLLVTGSSGIAAATARLWGAHDRVFIVGVKEEECRSLTAELPDADFSVADVRDEEAVRGSVAACVERFGRIDALFNVAGISARSLGDGPLHECSTEAWETVLDVNAKGTFLMCREVLRVWTRDSHKGVILNTGSVLARHPQREHFATVGYAASKGAIEAMSLSAAAYYAPAEIRVNVIAAGLVLTPMSARAQGDAHLLEYVAQKQPLTHGMLAPEDIAKAAYFLLRRDSSPITGQVVTVDGGWAVSA